MNRLCKQGIFAEVGALPHKRPSKTSWAVEGRVGAGVTF